MSLHERQCFAPPAPYQKHPPGRSVPASLTVSLNGRRRTRCFTVSSVEQGCPVVTIQAHAGGVVSNWANESVWVGDSVEIGAPAGDFVLPVQRPGRFLLIAAAVASRRSVPCSTFLVCRLISLRNSLISVENDLGTTYYRAGCVTAEVGWTGLSTQEAWPPRLQAHPPLAVRAPLSEIRMIGLRKVPILFDRLDAYGLCLARKSQTEALPDFDPHTYGINAREDLMLAYTA